MTRWGSMTRKRRKTTGRSTAKAVGRFRSQLEARVAKLPALKSAAYEAHRLPYVLCRDYVTDFTLPNGIHLEVKGYLPPVDRAKMRAVKQAHPDADIRLVLQTPTRVLSKRSKTTYAAWAEKYGFPWCSATDSATLTRWSREKGAKR